MTFPSSSAPLAGISRARLPAWALPDGWPTQANGEPLLADLAFRDGRIAALTPTDQPTPGLWDLAGALTLPGLVEPHAHLDKTFTIERCRPAQAGLLAAIHAMHEDRQHWTRADIQRRASAALARAAANGVTYCVAISTGLPPTHRTPGRRSPASIPSASPWSGWRWSR